MATGKRVRIFTWVICLRFLVSICVVSGNERTLSISEPTSLELSPDVLVANSPGYKPGIAVLCERVHVHGLSRIQHLSKMAHSVRLKVVPKSNALHPTKFEVCFHRNLSLGICMCPQNQWEKVSTDAWIRPMSPFDQKLLDIRVGRHTSKETLVAFEVSAEEEFFLYRLVLLALGFILMTFASSLSKSLVFYYSSAMTVGIILVILMVLFQGMRLLPTGRRSSLAIFMYSSIIGLGSFLLRYLPGLLHSILSEMGITEDMYYPLAIFLLAFLVLTGAWLGFWAVRKLILTEDGSVDIATSKFVSWSIRILAGLMILQCSLDPILAAEALICGIATSALLRRVARLRFLRRLSRNLFTSPRDSHRRSQNEESNFLQDPYLTRPSWQGYELPPSETYYSSFHTTPERRHYSENEWKKFTKDYTKKSLEDLVSSPEFSKWAVAHADRITLRDTSTSTSFSDRIRKWFPWF